MKYVITGGAGHISKNLTEQLLAGKHEVVVISRSAENLKELVEKGAKAAIGSVEDLPFLQSAFAGADVVYTMVPPNFSAQNWKAFIASIGANYAAAFKATGVPYVVNLSSIGAHLPAGCGPVTGLYSVEQELNALPATNVLHLRPGYFYNNLLSSIPMIRNAHILGSNFGKDDQAIILSAPADIADYAAAVMQQPKFTGHSVKYLASDEQPVSSISKIIGTAIGNASLPWIRFTDQQMYDGLVAAGLPKEIAENYVEMGSAIDSGEFFKDFQQHRPKEFGQTKLEDFAEFFANAYGAIK
jgi:uncharacterized protein YbjT (DUF2867 family)